MMYGEVNAERREYLDAVAPISIRHVGRALMLIAEHSGSGQDVLLNTRTALLSLQIALDRMDENDAKWIEADYVTELLRAVMGAADRVTEFADSVKHQKLVRGWMERHE